MQPLAITPGEPAGIGPELVVALAQAPARIPWVAIADVHLLEARARLLGLPLRVASTGLSGTVFSGNGVVVVHEVPLTQPSKPGELNVANASYVLATLERAAAGCAAGEFSAMVTGPVHKGVVADAGHPFTGHTEWLQTRFGVNQVVMLLVAEALRVALLTTHVALAEVPALITRPRLASTLRVLIDGLRAGFGIPSPRILCAGLNPHAGEGGHLGREEIDIITPELNRWRAEGHRVEGPLPADTLFTPHVLAGADAVLAMYHDQGLPVLKHVGFGTAVNVTLGLPIVRTSVDHGTALDIAGTGRGDCGSLRAALALAWTMVNRRAASQ